MPKVGLYFFSISLREEAVMSGNGQAEECVFFLCACTNIVDNQGPYTINGFSVGNNQDMWQFAINELGDQITSQVVCGFVGKRQFSLLTAEKDLKIGYAPMVDIWISSFESPDFRVSRKVLAHIFMYGFLQVIIKGSAISANQYIRADAFFHADVPSRIGKTGISWIIVARDANLASGGLDESGCRRLCGCYDCRHPRRKRQ